MTSQDGSELEALRQHLRVARRHLELAERLLQHLTQDAEPSAPNLPGVAAPSGSSATDLRGAGSPTQSSVTVSSAPDLAGVAAPGVASATYGVRVRVAVAAWLRCHPRLAITRGIGVAALIVATLLLWRLHDTAPATLLWALAMIVFVATWCVGQQLPPRKVVGVLAVACAVALAVRLFGIDRLDLGIQGDESATALVARQLLRGGAPDLFASRSFGIPTLGYVWFAPLLDVLPSPIAAVRATSAIAGAATVAAVGAWAWSLGGMRLAIFATILLGTTHTALYLSHLGTSNSLALFFATVTLAALSVALVRGSTLAAVAAALGLVGAWCTWAGAREILPVFALGGLICWRGTRRLQALNPFGLAVGATILLLLGPALSVAPDQLATFTFPRSESALLSSAAQEHTAQIAGTADPVGMFGFQLERVLSAFEPDTFGDRSPFYHFGRPIIDPLTLILMLVGGVLAVRLAPRQRAWLLPLGLVSVAVLTTLGTINPPDYPRLSMVLPAAALLAALPLACLSAYGRRGLALSVGGAALIVSLNLWWYFVDYPREGEGDFEQALLLRLAEAGPVYVVTPDFYFQHETLVLLDPLQRIQSPPAHADPHAAWIAVGPEAQQQLERVQPEVPDDTLRAMTDNAGRIVLYALLPPDRV